MELSVVIPVYNSAEIIPELTLRLSRTLARIVPSQRFEVILVNDGCRDGSWNEMKAVVKQHTAFRIINLRKNAGQHSALLAGLASAQGAVVILMDDDLQHDPEDIPKLRDALGPDVDVCYATFSKKHHAWWKRWGSGFNDWTAAKLIGKPRGLRLSSFKALKGEIVEEIVKYGGPFPYVDGLIFTITGAATNVVVTHQERFAGKGNYSFLQSLFLWTKMATNFSVLPLRMASFAGVAFSFLGLAAAVLLTFMRLVDSVGADVPGWASILIAVLVIGGVQLIALGAIGEYLGRAYVHLNGKPQYVVKDRLGFPEENDHVAKSTDNA